MVPPQEEERRDVSAPEFMLVDPRAIHADDPVWSHKERHSDLDGHPDGQRDENSTQVRQ